MSDNFPLVTTEWLAKHLNDDDIRVVDIRWHSRFENGKGISVDDYDGYLAGHIPGAVFAGMISGLSDSSHPVTDMLAPPHIFEATMSRLGIGNDTLVVAYDNLGVPFGSSRLWWALSYYGHDRVKVLDGGLHQWQQEGRSLSTTVPKVAPSIFEAMPRPDWIVEKTQVVAALNDPKVLIIDCLLPEQFSGENGKSLWGPRAGHIPGAVNVPALVNIDPSLAEASLTERENIMASRKSFQFSSRESLFDTYVKAGVSPEKSVITYCGRGYAASCAALALKIIGHDKVALYDGSWAEWANDPSLPVQVGKR